MNRKKLTLEFFNSLTAKQQAYLFEKLEKHKYTFNTRQQRPYYGVGFVDVSFPISINIEGKQIRHPAFRAWSNMLRRAYYTKNKQKYNCIVCKEWHSFSNFLQWWWDNAPNENYSHYHLDKDINNLKVKIYSPEHCDYVPWVINLMFRVNRRTGKLYNFN